MRFRNLTRNREIGANSYLLESKDHRCVIDSGMHPKAEGILAMPNFESLREDSIDSILLSHPHHDHLGSLPVLQRNQPAAPVYMTEFTGEIADIMLHNSVNVMTKQRIELNIPEFPLFTHREVEDVHRMWSYVDLQKRFYLGDSDLVCSFHDAGHIVGSTGIQIQEGDKRLFYTGDVCFESQTLSLPADFPTEGIDVLIMETTRGDHQRAEGYTRRSEKEKLAAVIRDTFAANGAMLIPVFALGKTQEVMLMLHELHQNDLIPEMPLFIGGLSTKVTMAHDKYASSTRRAYPGFRLLEDIDILVASTGRRKKEILPQSRCIYALSSGMMSENTTSNAFAQKFLHNPKNTIAFVGYTDKDSPGFAVRNAKPGEKVVLDKRQPPVTVNARVESFDFSAHATRESLMDYVKKLKPKKILLVHGDEPAQLWFVREINAACPEIEVIRPEPGKWVDLW